MLKQFAIDRLIVVVVLLVVRLTAWCSFGPPWCD
jgi:hypothetical protein